MIRASDARVCAQEIGAALLQGNDVLERFFGESAGLEGEEGA